MADTTTTTPKRKNEAERLEDMLEQLSPGDKIIVYRVVIDPSTLRETRPVKAVLKEFQGVEDLDSWIFDMAADQHWPAGEYILDHRKQGGNGSHCRKTLSLDPPPAPSSAHGAAPAPSALELVKQAKEILGVGARPEASPDAVIQLAQAAVKVGADAAGPKTQAPDATATLLKPLIEGLVARLGKEPPAAPDPWALLKQLKDMGLIGQQPTTDTGAPKPLVEQIGELKELLDVVGDLRGPAGPAAETTAVAVAKIFAPYMPQVLHTINNVVDVVRMRFGMTGQLAPPPGAPGQPPRPIGPPPVPPAVQALVARTQAAIGADDDGFFPAFAEGITTHIGDGRNFLLAIQAGRLEEEQALLAVQGAGLLNPAEPRTRAWLIRFVHWLRAAQPMAAAEPSPSAAASPPPGARPLAARCERCQQEYAFDSREAFEQDTRICDTEKDGEFCKGNIVLLGEDAAP